jgi:DNA-binding transcriptional regulator GbsR (MarR family)
MIERTFVERFRSLSHFLGVSEGEGAALAYLLWHGAPRKVEEIAVGLDRGHGSVWKSLESLTGRGLVKQVHLEGRRAIHYQAVSELPGDRWVEVLQGIADRLAEFLPPGA